MVRQPVCLGVEPLSRTLHQILSRRSDCHSVSSHVAPSLKRGRVCLEQWLRIALSKWPNKVGAAIIFPEDGNRSSFQNVFLRRHSTINKVQKHDSFKYKLHIVQGFSTCIPATWSLRPTYAGYVFLIGLYSVLHALVFAKCTLWARYACPSVRPSFCPHESFLTVTTNFWALGNNGCNPILANKGIQILYSYT
jgi:hypothetical protein